MAAISKAGFDILDSRGNPTQHFMVHRKPALNLAAQT